MFRPSNRFHWHFVVWRVESWLINFIRDRSSPYWTWGQDIFWLAFLGAYPDFPNGNWEAWDSLIDFDGPVILKYMPARWAHGSGNESSDEEGTVGEDVSGTGYALGSARERVVDGVCNVAAGLGQEEGSGVHSGSEIHGGEGVSSSGSDSAGSETDSETDDDVDDEALDLYRDFIDTIRMYYSHDIIHRMQDPLL